MMENKHLGLSWAVIFYDGEQKLRELIKMLEADIPLRRSVRKLGPQYDVHTVAQSLKYHYGARTVEQLLARLKERFK